MRVGWKGEESRERLREEREGKERFLGFGVVFWFWWWGLVVVVGVWRGCGGDWWERWDGKER